jgi:hypothetical protein
LARSQDIFERPEFEVTGVMWCFAGAAIHHIDDLGSFPDGAVRTFERATWFDLLHLNPPCLWIYGLV